MVVGGHPVNIGGGYWLFLCHCQFAEVMRSRFVILQRLCSDESIFEVRLVAQKCSVLNLPCVKIEPLGGPQNESCHPISAQKSTFLQSLAVF